MSITVMKKAPAYLRTARLAAGYASRDMASEGVPFSPETIGRHERGEVAIEPEDAMAYAKGYGRGDLLFRYCADCPIGRETGKRATDRTLSSATLRLTYQLQTAAEGLAHKLAEIAYDDMVDEGERPVFDDALASLMELGEAITDMVLYAAMQNGRPAPTGTAVYKTHGK